MAAGTSARTELAGEPPPKVVERNIELLGQFMKYILAHAEILERLPADFELVILPDDDAEIRRYNLDLLSAYGSEGKPVVFARVAESKETDLEHIRPDLYVPLVA
jgi:hypothetical protein